MRKSNIAAILCLFLLVACSSNTKSDWSCQPLDGGKGSCISISEADDKSDDLKVRGADSYFDSAQKIEIKLIAPKLKDLEKVKKSGHEIIDSAEQKPNKQFRTEEKVGRIWFAPRIDNDGNQHSESVIQIIDEPSRWVIQR